MKMIVAMALICSAVAASGQKYDVKIIDRQDNRTNYTYIVPERYGSDSTYTSSSASTYGYDSPAHQESLQVTGATLSLLLPDGRIAVVNCNSKFFERFAGPSGNRRSCRVPPVDQIRADFHGDKAKLEWPVSLDGKKWRSETYEILRIVSMSQRAH